jgi:anti-anti-sigma factor
MRYSIDRQGNFASIILQEEKLDTSVAPDLKSQFVVLTNEGITHLVLDIGSVSFADSSGLSALLVANRLTRQNDGTFALCGIQTSVQKLLEISHLTSVLTIYATRQEAEAELRTMAQETGGAGEETE